MTTALPGLEPAARKGPVPARGGDVRPDPRPRGGRPGDAGLIIHEASSLTRTTSDCVAISALVAAADRLPLPLGECHPARTWGARHARNQRHHPPKHPFSLDHRAEAVQHALRYAGTWVASWRTGLSVCTSTSGPSIWRGRPAGRPRTAPRGQEAGWCQASPRSICVIRGGDLIRVRPPGRREVGLGLTQLQRPPPARIRKVSQRVDTPIRTRPVVARELREAEPPRAGHRSRA